MKLITKPTNLRYLTGFTGSKGFLLIGTKKNYLVTDSRYIGFAKKLQKQKTRIKFEVTDDIKKAISKAKIIEFESDYITVDQLKTWKKKFKNKKFIPIKPISRVKKTDSEIKNLKKSQRINKKALSRVRKLLKPGVTELEIAWKIKEIGHKLGAEDVSFEPIVAFGKNSAIPHHQNSKRKLKRNDIVLIDMGMKYKGYCSDLTRTFFTGKATKLQKEIYKKVDRAQKEAIKIAKAGIKVAKLDKAAKKEMGEYEKFFTHSLGHGVGLEIHEPPHLDTKSQETLLEKMVVTVEPGIYLPDKFGVRIEDMILIKKEGFSIL